MKQIRSLRLLLLPLLLALVLTATVACGEEKPPETVYHTVAFDTAGGTEIAPQQVAAGKHAQRPDDPVREGYIFGGWKNGVLNFVFEAHAVTQPLTLRAVWLSAEDLFTYELDPVTEEICIVGVNREVTLELLAIPSVIKGFDVTSIGERAFASLTASKIPAVTIPASITSIGYQAFLNCTDVAITPEGAFREVAEEAFRGCNRLMSVKLAEGMESIAYQAFSGCTSLRSVVIPDSVSVISENAFEQSGLVYVVLPAGLERVEDSAFWDCNIKNVFCKEDNTEIAPVIGSQNQSLTKANRYAYSEDDTASGTWYFNQDGVPQIRSIK